MRQWQTKPAKASTKNSGTHKESCLFDVVDDKALDASIRPNQIFAVSLDYTMLDREKSLKVVEIVNRELVTPYGLRTLSLGDPKFVGKCSGDSRSRDMAYHNGTIWPWLLGPYVTAYLKVNDYTPKHASKCFENLILPSVHRWNSSRRLRNNK